LWLAHWSDQVDVSVEDSTYYVGVYCAIAVASLLCVYFYYLLTVGAGIRAAAGMHDGALAAIMRAPTSFYDQTPSGRLLNRFTVHVASI
jgi:ATP-binding cassette subfamily C (CFTR/MRP) protein 10